MEHLFGIENFNIIEDEENYYFFRALNMADNNNLETGVTLDNSGNIQRIRTDCISLSSNGNVSISYGRGFYKDRYVIVKVPKRELGENVINAVQYMLEEIARKV